MKSIKARTSYAIIGGDFSGQEPRSMCAFAQDVDMQAAYLKKQDLYSSVAAKCYHNRYEDNLEFQPQPDGTVIQSQEGKERRSKAKQMFLGINYGMSPQTLAKRMQLPYAEAQAIVDSYYEGFKGIDKFTKESQEMAKKLGYVTNMYGRRRHLPDAQLPKVSVKLSKQKEFFNPFLNSREHVDKVLEAKMKTYEKSYKKAKRKEEKEAIKNQALAEGIIIRNNEAFINRSSRQSLNARVQGTAATMTKVAMIKLNNDPELKQLGARLLVTIHDEVFCEAPIANKDRVAEKLCELMVEAANEKCSFTPWAVDPYIVVDGWYEDENQSKIHETYEKAIKKGKSEEDAIKIAQKTYSMYNPDSISLVCHKEYIVGKDSLVYGPNYYLGK